MNEQKRETVFQERDRLKNENANLHFLIEQANGALAELRSSYDRVRAAFEAQTIEKVGLRNKLGATEEALQQVQRASAELRTESEAARKVAHAAVASRIAGNAYCYINQIEPSDYDARCELAQAQSEAEDALNIAIIEYRSFTEYGVLPAPDGDGLGFFPGFPPGFDVKRAEKGLAQADCVCGHSRGRHITAIQGQPLGKCHEGGCACVMFQGGAQETAQFEPRIGQD